MRWVKTGNFEGHVGTTFWATNQTSDELALTLCAIETDTGSDWATAASLGEPLYFRDTGNLKPYSAAYTTLKLAGQPTDGTWRVRVSVSKKLTGSEGARERLKRYPFMLQMRSLGHRNIPINPFSSGVNVFGHVGDIVSEEISNE